MKNNKVINFFKEKIERSTFGVIDHVGNKFGINSSELRLYFIYITFITFGSPVLIYLALFFWLNLKKFIRNQYSYFFN